MFGGPNQVSIATGFMIFMGDEGNEDGTGGNKLLYLGTRPSEMSPRNFPGGGGETWFLRIRGAESFVSTYAKRFCNWHLLHTIVSKLSKRHARPCANSGRVSAHQA